ncbi:MAG: 30S ribosomal protein THX [bacterium]
MGKGDKRSKRGKIFAGSYGKYRQKRKTNVKVQKPKAVETKQ